MIFLDLSDMMFLKNYYIESIIFHTHSNKIHPKIVNTLFVIKLRSKFELVFQKLYKNNDDRNHKFNYLDIV